MPKNLSQVAENIETIANTITHQLEIILQLSDGGNEPLDGQIASGTVAVMRRAAEGLHREKEYLETPEAPDTRADSKPSPVVM